VSLSLRSSSVCWGTAVHSVIVRRPELGGLPPLTTPYAVNITEVMAVTDLPAGEGSQPSSATVVTVLSPVASPPSFVVGFQVTRVPVRRQTEPTQPLRLRTLRHQGLSPNSEGLPLVVPFHTHPARHPLARDTSSAPANPVAHTSLSPSAPLDCPSTLECAFLVRRT